MTRPSQPPNVAMGQVWKLPKPQVDALGYPGGGTRYCLVAAVERAVSGEAVRIWVIVGSTRPGGQPTISVCSGEVGTPKDTHFRFWWTKPIMVSDLPTSGPVGALRPGRVPEIAACIARSSRFFPLRRLVGR